MSHQIDKLREVLAGPNRSTDDVTSVSENVELFGGPLQTALKLVGVIDKLSGLADLPPINTPEGMKKALTVLASVAADVTALTPTKVDDKVASLLTAAANNDQVVQALVLAVSFLPMILSTVGNSAPTFGSGGMPDDPPAPKPCG